MSAYLSKNQVYFLVLVDLCQFLIVTTRYRGMGVLGRKCIYSRVKTRPSRDWVGVKQNGSFESNFDGPIVL